MQSSKGVWTRSGGVDNIVAMFRCGVAVPLSATKIFSQMPPGATERVLHLLGRIGEPDVQNTALVAQNVITMEQNAKFEKQIVELERATSENPNLCVTRPQQNAHLPGVNSAFVEGASLDFGVFGGRQRKLIGAWQEVFVFD